MRNKTVDTHILERYGRFLVRLPRKYLKERTLGTFDTLEEAQAARDREIARHLAAKSKPVIEGLTNEYQGRTPDDLWSQAYSAQDIAQEREALRRNQSVTLPDAKRHYGVAWFSDCHFGSAETDYRALKRDAEIVNASPDLFAEFHGDGIDNWVNAKLAHLQRDQALQFDGEIRLCADWLGMLRDKWIAIVCGNHDNWTKKLAGFDQIRQCLEGVRVLYDSDEVCFTLTHGDNNWRIKLRHKWKYGSVVNSTHPIEVGWQEEITILTLASVGIHISVRMTGHSTGTASAGTRF